MHLISVICFSLCLLPSYAFFDQGDVHFHAKPETTGFGRKQDVKISLADEADSAFFDQKLMHKLKEEGHTLALSKDAASFADHTIKKKQAHAHIDSLIIHQ